MQEEAAAAERARLAAISAAEAAKAREEHARLRALHAEERRLEKEEHRQAREAAHRHRAGHRSDVPADDAATRSLSLTDELFGIGDVGDDETSTIQMPRADHQRDER